MRYVVKTDTCWLWVGTLQENGYGTFSHGGVSRRAHRVAHELWVGPIGPGLQVDHVKSRGCTHRNCVNPDHLEAVTPRENMRRARKSHCIHGHPLTDSNVYLYKGKRHCRPCRVERAKKLRSKRDKK